MFVFLRFAVLLLSLAPAIAVAADAMRPNDIKATFFNGQPFTGTTPSGTQFKMTFTPDGKALREPLGSSGGPTKSGTWRLSPAGFCTSWAGAKPSCCQSALKIDPRSASNFDPFVRRVLAVALAPSELAGVAETARARVV
jgi:hypothetical protein